MQIVKQIPFYLLALVFIVFGANFFFNFIPMPPLEGLQKSFFDAVGPTGYMATIKVLEIIGGILILFPKSRAKALCILTPICLNILFFELYVAKQPGLGILLVLLCVVGVYLEKDKFKTVLNG